MLFTTVATSSIVTTTLIYPKGEVAANIAEKWLSKLIPFFISNKTAISDFTDRLVAAKLPKANYAFAANSSISGIDIGYSSKKIRTTTSISSSSSVGNQNDLNNNNTSHSGLAVDTYPIGVAVNPVSRSVYVTNEFSNTISVIDGTTDSIKGTISTGSFPYGIAVNPFNDRVYAANRGSNTVSVVDGSTDTKLPDVQVGSSPVGIAVNPSSNWIYVTNINSNTVSVIDGISNKISATIKVGNAPYGIAVNPLSNKVYVANIESNTVSVIDSKTNNILSNITVGKNPVGVAINTLSNMIYVTNHLSNSVSVIDGKTNSLSDTISVGKNPVGISANPVTNKVYVTNMGANTVSVIDGRTNKMSNNIAVNPILHHPNSIGDPILNIPVLTKFPLIASFVAIDTISNRVYVTNTGSDTVTVIDGNKNNVSVKESFNVNPANSGDIQCNGQQIISNSYVRYSNGTDITCTANAAHGYKFGSWSGLFDSNQNNPLKFKASQYGTLTANFKESLSFEQYLAIILGPVSIMSIVIGWFFRNRQRKYLNKYMTTIDVTYGTLFKNGNGNKQDYLLRLDNVRREIIQLYIKGRISDAHYNVLDRMILEHIDRASRSSL
jgi:YVTN family beta-propeller protein